MERPVYVHRYYLCNCHSCIGYLITIDVGHQAKDNSEKESSLRRLLFRVVGVKGKMINLTPLPDG